MPRILTALLLLLFCACASAQTYPSRPVRLVSATAPGGGIDIVSRLLAARLQEALGQPVVVENRPGASGAIGAEHVRGAAPDGHTLLSGFSGQMVINPVQTATPFDPVRDFEPVALVGQFPVVLVVNPALPANTVAELVAHARANPGKLNYASGSAGFLFATEIFKQKTGAQIREISFTGSAAAVAAVLGGTVDLAFVDVPPALGQIQAGKLRALGVTTAQRVAFLPGVPAIAESVPGYDFVLWIGVFAPAGTPKAIVDRLHQEIARAATAPETREKLLAAGVVPVTGTSQEMGELLRKDLALIRKTAQSLSAAK